MEKAAVLPVPVWAAPMTSRPASTRGMALAWIGVIVGYLMALRIFLSSGSVSKRAGGACSADTVSEVTGAAAAASGAARVAGWEVCSFIGVELSAHCCFFAQANAANGPSFHFPRHGKRRNRVHSEGNPPV